jgi:hypothetical protein
MRPIVNLFHGEPGSSAWKRSLDRELVQRKNASVRDGILIAMQSVPDAILDQLPS